MDKVDELIREVAARNGVAVSRDDPIMVMVTLHEQLLKDSQESQARLLEAFKSELEGVATQWSGDAKEKAERILNAALGATKEAMARLMQEGAKSTADLVKSEMQPVLARVAAEGRKAQRVAYMNLIAAGVTLVAALAVVVTLVAR